MAVAIAFTPAEWQADIGGTVTITGLTAATAYIVQTYPTGNQPTVNLNIGPTGESPGFGGGHTAVLTADGGGTITTTWVPSSTQPVNVAVYSLPVQQGTTGAVNVVSGE